MFSRPLYDLARCMIFRRPARIHSIAIILLMCGFTSAAPAQETPAPNLALNKPVDSSGPNWGSFVPDSLTDGDPNTFTHPLAAAGTLGFYYEVDLGRVHVLDRILLRNRADGCCPERLTRFLVEVYDDQGGETGALNWTAQIRADGSNSGTSGIDIITSKEDPDGTFAGRFIRIVNNSSGAYNPQLAEIEVYGGVGPTIRFFNADADTIATGESTTLRWDITRALAASISPGIGPVPPTNGTITVRPTSSTIYTLTASNEMGTVTATLPIGVNVTLAPPQLTEFLADNAGNLRDEDGDSSDWIELRNPNPYYLNLSGYYLTDNPADRTRWQFPAARIPPRGFLLVFASGKNRREPTAELHTNFRIGAGGDYLALVDKGGASILQQFPTNYPIVATFPGQRPNISYGLSTNGNVGFFRPATPHTTNGVAYAGIVADTKFSVDRGFYDAPFTVAISSATRDAVIRYTTNRTEPRANQGLLYTAPITISKTTVLRAAAFKEGWAQTDVDTHTYVFLSDVIASSVMRTTITQTPPYSTQIRDGLKEVPSMSIVTPATINGTSEVKASVEWLDPAGQPGVQEDCGVRHFGGAFTDFAKKNFRLYFRSDYGATKFKYPLFAGFDRGLTAVDEFDQLELRGGSHDMEQRGFYMSNIFADDTMLDMGQMNPHGRFVHLYHNGTYWGLYHLRERWGAAMHESYLGGARTNYESINGNWNVGGWAEPGTPYDGDGSTWALVKSLRDRYAEVHSWLDVPQFADYMLMWMFGGAEDEYRCVGPTVPGSGFKFYLNDADGYFCGPWYCAAGDRTGRGAPGRAAGDGPGSLFSMLYKEANSDYRTLLADRIYKAFFNGGALSVAQTQQRLSQRCQEIQRAFIAESARWNYLTPAVWASRRDSALTAWLPRRSSEALSQFRNAGFYPSLDAPVLNQQGGIVTSGFEVRFLAPVQAQILFTLDGSDPRLPGGGVSPSAILYETGGRSEILVPAGAFWRWFTDATGLGPSDIVEGHPSWSAANWKHPQFNDAAWKENRAQFGYGEQDEETPLPFGNDPNRKWVTSYFRHRFQVNDLSSATALKLRLLRDDGAIVYLNGYEAARSSMRAGVATGSTPGDPSGDDGQGFNDIALPLTLLQAGQNLIAVELHQATPTTTDASFDLELILVHTSAGGGTSLPVLTQNTVLKSRARNGSQWSALNEAFFQIGPSAVTPGEVMISELNFNPAGDDGTEFVELLNASGRAINLRGAKFVEGISYAFPNNRDVLLAAGQRLLLVNDLFRFQRRYELSTLVAGIYSGNLANDGETITLVTASNAVLASVAYSDAPPWPGGVDGQGYTLVMAHPELGMNQPAAWLASARTNGTPGGVDFTRFSGEPNLDADNDGLPAIVEYALGTSDTDPASGIDGLETRLDGSGVFSVNVPRNQLAGDVRVMVETSVDLVNWFPAQLLTTQSVRHGLALESWGVQAGTTRQLFLRVMVHRP
ncbi:MAG: lamin tail domain-containing protein [Verrucomicrobiota bacterium]